MNQSSSNRRQGSKGTSLRLRRRLTTFLKVTILSVPAKLKFPWQSMSVAITPWCHSQSVGASPSSQIPVTSYHKFPGGYTYMYMLIGPKFRGNPLQKDLWAIFCLVWAFCWETVNISHHSLLMQVTHKVETSNPLQQLSSIPKVCFSEA